MFGFLLSFPAGDVVVAVVASTTAAATTAAAVVGLHAASEYKLIISNTN